VTGRGAFATLALLASSGCASGPTDGSQNGPDPLSTGDHEFALTVAGRSRYYLVRVPPAAQSGAALPVVLALHGGGGNPDQFKEESDFDVVADREGFLAVYPAGNGTILTPRTLLTWNAGTDCCGTALQQNVDDVEFLLAVVEHLAARTPVDEDRLYAAGHSNGAMMAYRLAAEAADRLAAIAPVAGAMQLATFSPGRAVPVLHIHSVDDPRALYDGGLGPPFPLGGNQVFHQPVVDGLEAWRSRNGCPEAPEVTAELEGSVGTVNEGHTAEKLVWAPCATGAPVVHWRMTGVGHGWPGRILSPAREELVGGSTTLLSAPEEAWTFFEGFELP
jgi:polyhydroxybutyrate depolymerase